jgi:hypothetical protein
MKIKDRIKELRRVKADALRPNPRNWRSHPQRQRDVLCGVLAEIGYAGALLARELPDGSLELIDGHLRAETTPDMEVPVLVLDLSEQEADKLLALHDPLAGMAEADREVLHDLAARIETENDAVRTLLDGLWGGIENLPEEDVSAPPNAIALSEAFQVVVECRDEDEQRAVFDRLSGEGLKCKLLML